MSLLFHPVRCLLLLVLLQHLVAVVLDTTDHFRHKVRGLALEEPAKSDNALGNCTQVVEQRRCSVRFTDVINAIRCFVEIGHQLRVLGLGLLGLCRNVEIGALSLEGLQNRIGLWVVISGGQLGLSMSPYGLPALPPSRQSSHPGSRSFGHHP